MRILFLYCRNLDSIRKLLVDIYIDETMLEILGEEYEKLCHIFQNFYSKELLTNKILNITFEIIIYNIIDLILNKYKVETFIKMLFEKADINNIILVDNRLIDSYLFSNNIRIMEKENIYYLVIQIVNRYISTLVKRINEENNFRYEYVYDEIIDIYTCLNDQLYSEVNIENFRLEFVNDFTIMMIIYE